jgi:hypothetical protein
MIRLSHCIWRLRQVFFLYSIESTISQPCLDFCVMKRIRCFSVFSIHSRFSVRTHTASISLRQRFPRVQVKVAPSHRLEQLLIFSPQ